MRTRAYAAGLAGLSLITAASGAARALDKRAEVDQQGDFVLIGNTLAQDCGPATPLPVVGSLDCSGVLSPNDLAPDVLWRADVGAATADSSITVDTAQSAAFLDIPKGAEITHAYLYWAAQNYGMADNSVTLQCVGQGASPLEVQAQSNWVGGSGAYNAFADVKDYVHMYGSCAYLVSGVASVTFNGILPQASGYSVWWLVVFYKDPKAPHRHIVLVDGLDAIGNGGDSQNELKGFTIPNKFELFSPAKVGVAAYDGDLSLGGDQLKVGDVAMADSSGDTGNFFNSSRTYFGAPLSVAGDLPQLTGQPGSMGRLDLDVVNVSSSLAPGQTSLTVQAVSSGEPLDLAGIVLSVPTFTDEDGDGLSDDEEAFVGTSPTDVDSDDDGVADGKEGCTDPMNCPEPAWSTDTDGDGLVNALDPDSDNDGIFDGTELGYDCSGPGTTLSTGNCRPDADEGKTVTDPLNADSDGGGARDGSEDANLNGALDTGETDPTAAGAADDATVVDTDKDGLSDALEAFLGTNSNDADTDDDGLLDGLEANPSNDTDGDGLTNVLDVDSDNDALYDGTEAGKDCANEATKTMPVAHCIADADPLTITSPVSDDSDSGGMRDGAEDWNRNGAIDVGESDPAAGHKDDDATLPDADQDGLSDALETALASNMMDADTDDDGVVDGAEANPADDTDGDGAINVNDPDSDADGLFDGTERGKGCSDPSTDKAANHCIIDGDTGKTKTCSLDPDTDKGGVNDGTEDFNKDGVYDIENGEGDPNDKADDKTITPCTADAECGPPNSGVICDASGHCTAGCRGVDGSRCPEGELCSSEDSNPGYCIDATTTSSTGGMMSGTGTGGPIPDPRVKSCSCEVGPGAGEGAAAAWLVAFSMSALGGLRRKKQRAKR